MELGSSRLIFEWLRAEHAAGLFEPLADPTVYEHIGGRPPRTVAALAEEFARRAAGPPGSADERWLNCAIRVRADGALIGRVEATIVCGRAEVGYLFGVQYWGRGYAAEAMEAFQQFLRRNCGITECWATTSPKNTRSIRLLSRLGYQEVIDSWPALASYAPGDRVFFSGSSGDGEPLRNGDTEKPLRRRDVWPSG